MSWTPSDHSRKAGSDSEATSPSASIQDFETQQKKYVAEEWIMREWKHMIRGKKEKRFSVTCSPAHDSDSHK